MGVGACPGDRHGTWGLVQEIDTGPGALFGGTDTGLGTLSKEDNFPQKKQSRQGLHGMGVRKRGLAISEPIPKVPCHPRTGPRL